LQSSLARRVQGVSGVDLVPWLRDELYLDKYNITAASGPKYLLYMALNPNMNADDDRPHILKIAMGFSKWHSDCIFNFLLIRK